MIVEVAVHASSEFGGFGTESGASAFEEDDNDDAADVRVGVSTQTERSACRLSAGPGLTENIFFVEVELHAAGRAILHRAFHAVGNFRNEVSDGQPALDDGLEVRNLFRRGRVLQIIECAAVGNG